MRKRRQKKAKKDAIVPPRREAIATFFKLAKKMKVLTGKIVGINRMPKTVTVETESFRRHPLYKKIVRKNKKILAHLEGPEVKLGDKVKIGETRPISKNKHFKVLEVVKE